MAGYQIVMQIKRLEAALDKLGLVMCEPKGGWSYRERGDDMVAVKPKAAEDLPIYARDVELFCGTINELRCWLIGVEWARGYDMMLKLSDEKKRSRKEQDVRNEHMIRRMKNEELLLKGK